MKDNVEQFAREVEFLRARIPLHHLRLTAELAGAAIDHLVQISPVLTGAYRASHAVLDQSGQVAAEGPERPGGDEIIKPGSRAILQSPNGGDIAQQVIDRVEPMTRIEIWNGRFYASVLEYGDSTRAPRTIYGSSEVATEQRAREIAERRNEL